MLLFAREPVKILAFATALLELLSVTFFHFTDPQQAAVDSVITIVAGFLGALAVGAEKTLPFVMGLVQAVLACVLAFGVHFGSPAQGSVMAFVAAAAGMWLRTQVVAPVPAPTPAGLHVE